MKSKTKLVISIVLNKKETKHITGFLITALNQKHGTPDERKIVEQFIELLNEPPKKYDNELH